ncbi:MAG: DUF2804 domain-containing protein [Spirochaetia bacterium]|nr:DUF2804 domain-containing protein [Spirochaetia bacterium]
MSPLIENGNVRTGIFSKPITLVRPSDFVLRKPLGKIRGALAKRFAYKQFHYMGGISDSLVFGTAIVDLRYLSTVFYYVYDLKTGREFRNTWRKPLSSNVSFSEDPESGSVVYGSGKNFARVHIENGKRILEVVAAGKQIIYAAFPDSEPDVQPLRICTRAGYTGWVYVRKTGGVPLSGIVDCELGKFNVKDCLGHTDYSVGYMRPETWWNWAFASGKVGGKNFAMNVSCGVNETSYTENCYWLDGKLQSLPQAKFDFDAENPMGPWNISSSMNDDFSLNFTSRGVHKEHVNAGKIASRFSQMYGSFSGIISLNGKKVSAKDLLGFTEDHYAKW